MNAKQLFVFRKLTRLAYILGVAFLLAGMLLSMVKLPVKADPVEKIDWCHCQPNGNCETLHLPPAALIGGGHMDASGNPLHAGDHEGECEVPTETQVVTTPPTETGTPVVTDTPDVTDIPDVTETPITVQPLTVGYECIAGDFLHLRWTVYNPNSFDVPYTWQLWTGVNGPVNAPPGKSTITIAELTIATMTISFDNGKTASATPTSVEVNSCKPTPAPLEVTYVCAEDGTGIDWTIYNPNAWQVGYRYIIDSEPMVAGMSVNPLSSKTLHTTSGAHTITLIGRWGANVVATSPANACIVIPPDPMTLTHICEGDGDGITWKITNPNDTEALGFQWQIDGSALSSTIIVAPGTTYDVASTGGAHSFTITGDWGNANDSSDSNECIIIPPLDTLFLSYSCQEGLYKILWTLTNPNDEPVSFSYVLDGNPSVNVTDPVPANGSADFLLVDADGLAHTVIVTYMDNGTPVQLDPVTSIENYCCYVPTEDPKEPTEDPGDPDGIQIVEVAQVVTPGVVAAPEVLIPVTGIEFQGIDGIALARKLVFNMSFIFFGMAFVMTGLTKKMSKKEG